MRRIARRDISDRNSKCMRAYSFSRNRGRDLSTRSQVLRRLDQADSAVRPLRGSECTYNARTLWEEADFRPSGSAQQIIVNFREQQRPPSSGSVSRLTSTDENELFSLSAPRNYSTFGFPSSVRRRSSWRIINARRLR